MDASMKMIKETLQSLDKSRYIKEMDMVRTRTDEAVNEVNDLEQYEDQVVALITELDSGDGVLVLSDMYGSTPGNIATAMYKENRTNVLCGINLPMLARIFNYSQLDLTGITDAAITGGQKSIIECTPAKNELA